MKFDAKTSSAKTQICKNLKTLINRHYFSENNNLNSLFTEFNTEFNTIYQLVF